MQQVISSIRGNIIKTQAFNSIASSLQQSEKQPQIIIENEKEQESNPFTNYQTKQQYLQIQKKIKQNVGDNSSQENQTLLLTMIQSNPKLFQNSFNKYFGKIVPSNASIYLWMCNLYNELYIDGFKKADKRLLEITQFQQKFQAKLLQASEIRGQQLTILEKTLIKRLLQAYFKISKQNQLYHYTLCLSLIKIIPSNIIAIQSLGSCLLSLFNLSNHFASLPSNLHLQKFLQTIQLIDQESKSKIDQFITKSLNKKVFIKFLKSFVQSIGTLFLNKQTSKFFVDMILILGNNRMNIYIGLSIVFMILNSEQFQRPITNEQGQQQILNIVEIVEKRAKQIDIDNFRQIFLAVYQGVDINKLKNQQLQQEQQQNQSQNQLESQSNITNKPNNKKKVKTAICQLLQQQYEKKQKIIELQSLKQTKQSFQVPKDENIDLAGIVPVIVDTFRM